MKKGIFTFLLLMTGLCWLETKADGVYIGGWSSHWAYGESKCGDCYQVPKDKLNSDHDLIAVEVSNFVVGHMTNSFYRSTWIAVYQVEMWEGNNWRAIADVGATHGYRSCNYDDNGPRAKTCLAVGLELIYIKYRIQPSLISHPGTTVLSFKLNF